jgi:hypothetical protein
MPDRKPWPLLPGLATPQQPHAATTASETIMPDRKPWPLLPGLATPQQPHAATAASETI